MRRSGNWKVRRRKTCSSQRSRMHDKPAPRQGQLDSQWRPEISANELERRRILHRHRHASKEASLGSNGLLKCFEAKFHMFEEISNDWKNYNHLSIKKKIDKPVLIEK